MKKGLLLTFAFVLALAALPACYSWHDTGVNAAQEDANPDQGKLNAMNAGLNSQPEANKK